MKKLICLLIVVSSMLFSVSVCADDGTLKIIVDTKPVTYTDAVPFIENGRTMIPLRLVSENMQAEVDYNEKTGEITITKDSNCKVKNTTGYDTWTYFEYKGNKYENAQAKVVFKENSTSVKTELYQGKKCIHSTVSEMDACAKIIDGRTFVPARYVAYALGYGIYYDQPRNRILYSYKANQIADFESKAKYNQHYYNFIPLESYYIESHHNYHSWAYRDGYGKVKVLDGDNGWEIYKFRSNNERSYEMSNLTYMPVYFTFETEEYKLTSKNSPTKNFDILKKMLESKTDGEVTIDDEGIYHLNIFTYDELIGATYKNGKYIVGPQSKGKFDPTGINGMAGPPRYSRYDYTMFYYIDNGERIYSTGFKSSTVDNTAARYNLLFLETFLGEIGERIWDMMDDYHTHTGKFDMGDVYFGTSFADRLHYKDVEIGPEHAAHYGFDFVSSKNTYDFDSNKTVTLKYGDFEFSIRYSRDGFSMPQVGYQVMFENIPENK